jgi:hypothetical protein
MASLLLSFAGHTLGAAFGPVGAVAGRAIGALAGGAIDRALFGGSTRRQIEGPRLNDLDVMGSTEGAPIPRLYGRARLSGQVIWATKLEEVISTRTETTGGGKGGGGSGALHDDHDELQLFCEFRRRPVRRRSGEDRPRLGRRQAARSRRAECALHRGGEDQLPDPLIEAKEGAGEAPAYRGLCYLVFERLPLGKVRQPPAADFRRGRAPGRQARAHDPRDHADPGLDRIRLRHAAGGARARQGAYAPENRHVASAETDWQASLDELQAVCPNLERVALVVAWFGNDLRASHCLVRPAVDNASKQTQGATWSVAGRTRSNAAGVSLHDGRPAFGGTPSDASVVRAIEDLKARGLKVTFYPFVMMDIPADNTLPDPYTGEAGQPPYPWRGQITCDPAPGRRRRWTGRVRRRRRWLICSGRQRPRISARAGRR